MRLKFLYVGSYTIYIHISFNEPNFADRFKKLEKTAFNKFVKANDVTGNKRYESFFNYLNNFYLLNDTMKAYRLRLLVGYFGYLCFPASGPGPRPEICI